MTDLQESLGSGRRARRVVGRMCVLALTFGLFACETMLTPYGQPETVLIVTNVEELLPLLDDVRAFRADLPTTEALAAGESLVFVWGEFTFTPDVSFVVFIDENSNADCDPNEPAWSVPVDLAEGLDSEVFRGEIGEEVQCGDENPGDEDGRDGI